MTYNTLVFENEGAVGRIILNRPASMNAISDEMATELLAVIGAAARRDKLRVLVIEGAGRAFCCGADLKGILANLRSSSGLKFVEFLSRIQAVFTALRELHKPTIASINGMALAGGLELAMSCDLVIAARSARIGDAHANFGVLPGGGGGTLLSRYIGEKKANHLLFTGENWSAEALERAGLVSLVVDDHELRHVTDALARKVSEKSPIVISRLKQLVGEGSRLLPRDAFELEMALLQAHVKTNDFKEGLTAFSEKRTPKYSGT